MLAGMARRTRLIGLVVLLLGLLLAAACGDDDDDSSTSSTESVDVSSDMLDGRNFESTDVSGETLVDGSTIAVTFDGDGLSANAGCNTMNGTYEVVDGVLTVGPLSQTQMACEDDLQQQDVWIAALLEAEPTVTLADDTLTIASDSTTVTFESS